MPSLDEESARLVARARALLDGSADPAPSPQRSPWRRSEPSRCNARPPVATRAAATRSAPSGGASGRGHGEHGSGGSQRGEGSGDGTAPSNNDGGADGSDEEVPATSAFEQLGTGSNALIAPSSPQAHSQAALGGIGGHAALGSGHIFASAAGGGGVDPDGGRLEARLTGHGSEGAQQRVRQARLAEERVRNAAREEKEQKRVAEVAEQERVQGFREEAKRRATRKAREDREAAQAAKAAQATAAADKAERQRAQAAEAEEVRRSLANAIAARKAVSQREEQQRQHMREAQAAETAARSRAEGAQLQAAALARVRERRRQEAALRAQEEVHGELDSLVSAQRQPAERARAKDQRAAAAKRLRSRRERDEAGVASDGFVHAGRGRRVHAGGLSAGTERAPRSGAGSSVADHYDEGGGDDAAWEDADREASDDDGDEDGYGSGDGGAWFGGPSAGFTNVGFVIRGDEPDVAPQLPPQQRPRQQSQPRRVEGLPTQHGGRQGRRAGDGIIQPEPWLLRGGPLVEGTQDFVGSVGHAKGAAQAGGTGGRRAYHQRPPPPPISAPVAVPVLAEEAELPQVLEIRSPTKPKAIEPPPAGQRLPRSLAPTSLAARFDPPPPEPEPEPCKGARGGSLSAPATGASPTSSCKPTKPVGRRKPWQRPPVPLDRPIEL
jgi:hypothetical protein